MSEPNYYEVLGVEPTATQKEIDKKYRKIMRENHPDLTGSAGVKAASVINRAYSVLRDSVSRTAYDNGLKAQFGNAKKNTNSQRATGAASRTKSAQKQEETNFKSRTNSSAAQNTRTAGTEAQSDKRTYGNQKSAGMAGSATKSKASSRQVPPKNEQSDSRESETVNDRLALFDLLHVDQKSPKWILYSGISGLVLFALGIFFSLAGDWRVRNFAGIAIWALALQITLILIINAAVKSRSIWLWAIFPGITLGMIFLSISSAMGSYARPQLPIALTLETVGALMIGLFVFRFSRVRFLRSGSKAWDDLMKLQNHGSELYLVESAKYVSTVGRSQVKLKQFGDRTSKTIDKSLIGKVSVRSYVLLDFTGKLLGSAGRNDYVAWGELSRLVPNGSKRWEAFLSND